MNFEDLPPELKETIEALKHGSYTIECDVKDALEKAKNVEDFRKKAASALSTLIQEARNIMVELGHRKLTERERDRMIDIYASGPLTYVPTIDNKLIELDLVQFWGEDGSEINSEIRAVEAKHEEGFFYAKNGSVLKEWY